MENETLHDWSPFCGSSSFSIWDSDVRNFGYCFQKLAFEFVSFSLLTILSAYHIGKDSPWVVRTAHQKYLIWSRMLIVACLLIVTIVELSLYSSYSRKPLPQVEILGSVSQVFAWTVHLFYLQKLCHKISSDTRGKRGVIVVWLLSLLYNVCLARMAMAERSKKEESELFIQFLLTTAGLQLVLQVCYLCTLFPRGMPVSSQSGDLINGERTPLLDSRQNHYSRFQELLDPNYVGVAEEGVHWLSYLTFYWVNPIMEKGARGQIESPDDLFYLPRDLTCDQVRHDIETEIMVAQPLQDGQEPTVRENYYLFRALYRRYSRKFYLLGLLKLFADVVGFAGPLLLHELISFVQGEEPEAWRGYMAAAGLIIANIAGMLAVTHYNYQLAKLNNQLRTALITSIYDKVQKVNVAGLLTVSEGEVVNYMSTDTNRIVRICEDIHECWSMPLQLGITLFLLYSQVGISFLAGIGITLLVFPLNKFLANKIYIYYEAMMDRKDKRVNIMSEILHMMKAIKLSAWETLVKRKISAARLKEVQALTGLKYLGAGCVYLWATTPVLIPIATFVTYAALGNTMDAARIFTAVALFNMLIMPLNAFPWVLNGLIFSWVSMKRVNNLMQLAEQDRDEYYTVVPEMNTPGNDMQVLLANGSFGWTPSSPLDLDMEHLPLKEVSVRIKKGQFVGLVGKVGSGKTTFLNALIAEIEKVDGIVAVSSLHEGFSLATQAPWLQNCSIKENIIFGLELEQPRYQEVLYACCLEEDLATMPLGDDTRCGENGSALSGGQKARVALARAVYQKKDIYLFDDVLSAVDEPVARHIVQHCFHGFLDRKTIILVTHHTHLLTRADSILVMENGRLVIEGPPRQALQGLVSEDAFGTEWRTGLTQRSDTGTVPKQRTDSPSVFVPLSETQRDEELRRQVEGEELERRSFGELTLSVYAAYLSPIGVSLCTMIFFSMLLMQATRNLTDVWLAKWVSHSTQPVHSSIHFDNQSSWENFIGIKPLMDSPHVLVHHDLPTMGPIWNGYIRLRGTLSLANFDPVTKFYLSVYGGLAAINSLFALCRSFLFAYGGIVAAKILHEKLLEAVLYAKMSFFELNPLGRIVNRFSSDVNIIDNALPFEMNIFFSQLFGLCGSLFITLYGVPWIVLLYVPLVFLYYNIQTYYRHTSRDVRRIFALTMSPLYNNFSETITGLPVIRAMRASHRFSVKNQTYLESNQKAQFCLDLVSQWLNLRLQIIGTLVLTGVTVLSLLQSYKDGISPGLIGLVISYALSINSFLNGVVTSLTETERELISVERVNQYLHTESDRRSASDDNLYQPLLILPSDWPHRGAITFDNVSFKYQDHLPNSLDNVDLDIFPCEKIGFMGRTGAGKSSLFMALFRIVNLQRGRIYIDNVNINDIAVKKLRMSLSIVSQDVLLISGSIRENLDPRMEADDADIRNVIEQCHLREVVQELGGIEAALPRGGRDLSAGQRQLFCLARALLSKSKIVCIDEGTALLDNKTDHQIQTVIRQAFVDRTLLIIAHRIHTLRDCDRIIVMKDGRINRICSPNEIMDNRYDSLFED